MSVKESLTELIRKIFKNSSSWLTITVEQPMFPSHPLGLLKQKKNSFLWFTITFSRASRPARNRPFVKSLLILLDRRFRNVLKGFYVLLVTLRARQSSCLAFNLSPSIHLHWIWSSNDEKLFKYHLRDGAEWKCIAS